MHHYSETTTTESTTYQIPSLNQFVFPIFVFFEKSLRLDRNLPHRRKKVAVGYGSDRNSPAGLPPRSGFFKSPVPDATYLIFPTPPPPAITRTSLNKLVTPPILEVGHESRVRVRLTHLTSLALPGSTTAPGLIDWISIIMNDWRCPRTTTLPRTWRSTPTFTASPTTLRVDWT